MRLIFAGTPEFARIALEHLHRAGHEIALVLTQPDRPAGRGMHLHASPVKQFAQAHGLALAQPRGLRLDGKFAAEALQAQAAIEAAHSDAMVVAAYGLILPQWVLDAPARACLNIHASLLPRWRGAAPIQRAIEAGDAQTGVTIMQMDAGLDTGDMLMAHAMDIAPGDTSASLQDRLALLGARLIVLALQKLEAGTLKPAAQPALGVTYAHKIDKAEAAIDWRQDAHAIARRVRAFNPAPGASLCLQGERIKVWGAAATDADPRDLPSCGTIMAAEPAGIAVAAMNSIAILTELQRAGGRRMGVAEFLRGTPWQAGLVFDGVPA